MNELLHNSILKYAKRSSAKVAEFSIQKLGVVEGEVLYRTCVLPPPFGGGGIRYDLEPHDHVVLLKYNIIAFLLSVTSWNMYFISVFLDRFHLHVMQCIFIGFPFLNKFSSISVCLRYS